MLEYSHGGHCRSVEPTRSGGWQMIRPFGNVVSALRLLATNEAREHRRRILPPDCQQLAGRCFPVKMSALFEWWCVEDQSEKSRQTNGRFTSTMTNGSNFLSRALKSESPSRARKPAMKIKPTMPSLNFSFSSSSRAAGTSVIRMHYEQNIFTRINQREQHLLTNKIHVCSNSLIIRVWRVDARKLQPQRKMTSLFKQTKDVGVMDRGMPSIRHEDDGRFGRGQFFQVRGIWSESWISV